MKSKDELMVDAIRSLLDVTEELAMGIAHGQTPEKDWAQVAQDSFNEHRKELAEAFGHQTLDEKEEQ